LEEIARGGNNGRENNEIRQPLRLVHGIEVHYTRGNKLEWQIEINDNQ